MLPWLLPFIWEVGENNVLKIFVVRFNHTPDTSWLFWCDCDIGHNKANHFINCLHLYFTVLWTWLLVKRVYSFQSSSSLGLHSNKELRFFVNTFSCGFFFFFFFLLLRKVFSASELWNMGLSLAALRIPLPLQLLTVYYGGWC